MTTEVNSMATAVIMPRQGQSVESCIITKWNKKVGDSVAEGDILFSYETDKASFEEEAKISGTMLAILAEEGDDVPCLENVCVIGEPGEDVSGFAAAATIGGEAEAPAQQEASAAQAEAAPAEAPAAAATGSIQEGERIKISPRARGIAENQNLDIKKAVPTGPNGRIIERDILTLSKLGADAVVSAAPAAASAAEAVAPAAEYEDVPLPNIRKVIAKSMHASLSEMAQLTHSFSFDATQIMAYRKLVKENAEKLGLANITFNDIILYAVSRVLPKHKDLNAHFLGDKMRYFTDVNLGMAVDTPAAASAAEAVAPAAEYEDVPLPNIRKVIAKSMHASLSEMAQLTHSFSFDATQIMAYRKLVKENAEKLGLANITFNDIILYAVSRVLPKHKDLNAHFLGDKMRYFTDVNLGMAVDTPRGLLVPTIFGANKLSLNEIAVKAKELAKQAQEGTISPDLLSGASFTVRGLLVPTIFGANKLSLNEIAVKAKELAKQAQEGTISPDLLSGASFTVSNLGTFGVEHFTPVINPPQTGILGVNNIQTRLKMVDGEAVPYQAMGISLTYDHRALDGAPASRFAQELCKTLENFMALLAK